MTGFGRGRAPGSGFEVAVEINSVNRRGLETSFSLPKDWQPLERVLASRLREVFSRGKLHASVSVDLDRSSGGLTWDDSAVEATLKRLEVLAQKTGSPWPPSAGTLLRLALEHRETANLPNVDVAEAILVQALEEAIVQLKAMRGSEGTQLEEDFRSRIGLLQELLSGIEERADGRSVQYGELLMQRLKNAGLELNLEDERVLKEVALFADRCDVTEEITRLKSHLVQFDTTMDGEEDVVGRKLEFILQEIHREFNTIGSKSNNLEISKRVIEAKNEIERIREQIQNIE